MTTFDKHLPSSMEIRKRLLTLFLPGSTSYHDRKGTRAALLWELQQQGLQARLLGDNPSFIYGEYSPEAAHTLLWYTRCSLHSPHPSMLDAIVIALAALDAYQRLHGSLPVNIKWLIDTEDMMEHPSAMKTLQTHRELLQAEGCIWIEPAELVKDECIASGTKGLLRVALEASTTAQAAPYIPSSYGTIAPNAAWRLTWALSSLKNTYEEVLIEGFYDTLTPVENDEIALLHALPDIILALTQRWNIAHSLLGLQGVQLRYVQLLVPTCIIGAIHSAPSAQSSASLPTYAQAQLDFYLVPDQDPDDIFVKLRRHLDAQGFEDIQVRILYKSWPAHTSLKTPFAHAIQQATRKAYGHEPHILPLTMGSYPIYILQRELALPVIIIQMCDDDNWKSDAQSEAYLAKGIKQLVMIMEEIARAA